MAIEHKSLPFRVTELKAADNGGWEVAGYASTFGGASPDSYGDIVAKGAFLNSIAKRKTKLLYQHNPEEPIGKQLALSEDETGLFGRWSILPVDTGVKAHQLLQAELIDALSIGFQTVDAEYREDGVRVLKEVELFEVSLVTFPANDNAVITSFKSERPTDQLCKQATEALRVAVREVEALHERRSADGGRTLNDRQREAVEALVREAKAAATGLAALVTPPDAEATGADSQAHGLEAIDLYSAELRQRRARIAYLAQKGRISA